MDTPYWLITCATNVGLVLDIVGAIIITLATVWSTKSGLKSEGVTVTNINENKIISSIKVRLDVAFGGVFLLFGFLLQLYGNKISEISITRGLIVYSLAAVTIVIYRIKIRSSLFRKIQSWVLPASK